MFKTNGELFYPAIPGDPFYDDYVTNVAHSQPAGPSGFAEFFGDFIVVNGKAWPFMDVEPQRYSLRFLNGCDSRFLVMHFCQASLSSPMSCDSTFPTVPFNVIGGDKGLGSTQEAQKTRHDLILEPGSRIDILIDFASYPGKRIILSNTGWDGPFNGAYGPCQPVGSCYEERRTDRIMAFNVNLPLNANIPEQKTAPITGQLPPVLFPGVPDRVRKLGLFEGRDDLGRLQPLLGVAENASNELHKAIYWDSGPLQGHVVTGTLGWHSLITEKYAWELWKNGKSIIFHSMPTPCTFTWYTFKL
jgi:spore coat protein A, manganese oxidase